MMKRSALYRTAIAVAPDEAALHCSLGEAGLGLQGQSEEAKKELEEAVRLKPDYVEARKELILLALRQGVTGEIKLP